MKPHNGLFKKGQPGGPGRPKRAVELSYLTATKSSCSLTDWAEITRRAVRDAKRGSATARRWLSDILIGKDPMALQEALSELRDTLEELHEH